MTLFGIVSFVATGTDLGARWEERGGILVGTEGLVGETFGSNMGGGTAPAASWASRPEQDQEQDRTRQPAQLACSCTTVSRANIQMFQFPFLMRNRSLL